MVTRDLDTETRGLRLRLQNCIQTILDLKDDLDAIAFGASFLPELGSLERFLLSLEEIVLNEDEVHRVEIATEHFLQELKTLMLNGRSLKTDSTNVLQ